MSWFSKLFGGLFKKPKPKPTPPPIVAAPSRSEDWFVSAAGTIAVICTEEFGRIADAELFGEYFFRAREQGWTAEDIRAHARATHPLTPIVTKPIRPASWYLNAADTIRAVYLDGTGKDATPEVYGRYFYYAVELGEHADQLLARARKEAPPKPEVTPLSPVRADGKILRDQNNQIFRAVGCSALALSMQDAANRDALYRWMLATGFNTFRTFFGALTWIGQTPEHARAMLPIILSEARNYGLKVMVTINTDTVTGYDIRSHTREVRRICERFPDVVVALELANEPYHGTQVKELQELDSLHTLGDILLAGTSLPWGLGTATVDEPDLKDHYPVNGGDTIFVHLDRGRDRDNRDRRVREIAKVMEVTRKVTWNSEPIGAGEIAKGGSRESYWGSFLVLGALNRLFELQGVFHSEEGLFARVPGPHVQQCAEAFVAGSTCFPAQEILSYQNTGHAHSPTKDADFSQVVRVYNGIVGNRGIQVQIGVSGDPKIEWQHGWMWKRTIAESTIVENGKTLTNRVIEIQRS